MKAKIWTLYVLFFFSEELKFLSNAHAGISVSVFVSFIYFDAKKSVSLQTVTGSMPAPVETV